MTMLHEKLGARQFTLASAAFFLAAIPSAEAYLDPGTGSLMVQMVIGAIAAAGAAFTVYWQRIREFFGRGAQNKQPDPAAMGQKNDDSRPI